MLGYAVVRPKGRVRTLDRELWRSIIKTTGFLRRARPLRGVNPFTKAPFFVPKPDSAEVYIDGKSFGEMLWSGGRLYLDGTSSILTPLACQIADALGAVVEDQDGKPLTAPRGWTLEKALIETRAKAARAKRAALPAGKTVLVYTYSGRHNVDGFLHSGDCWSEFAQGIGLPPRDQAKLTYEQYDHRELTLGGRETQEVHRFEDEDGWPHRACVVDDRIVRFGRRAPDSLLKKLNAKSAPKRRRR